MKALFEPPSAWADLPDAHRPQIHPDRSGYEHVTVGGKFFDVLYGEYRLEPLSNGGTRLHLLSRHRVSTDFNWYAHLWTDAVMSDLQQRILLVVKNRSELAVQHI